MRIGVHFEPFKLRLRCREGRHVAAQMKTETAPVPGRQERHFDPVRQWRAFAEIGICAETATDKLVSMKRGDKLVRDFSTNELCHASGIFVEQNGRYRFTVDKTVDWKDGGSIPTTVGGYHINDVPGRFERIETFLLSSLKRVWIRPFFRFIVRTGSTGSEENFLDQDDHPENVDQLQERYTARKDGELFFYVNDGVIALPYFDSAFYSRNQGTAKITVERF